MENSKKIYSIPPNTIFWSISLQETVSSEKELYVRETNNDAYTGEPIFGVLQCKFENVLLQQYIGNDAISYVDKANGGEISIDFKKCNLIKEIK